MNPSEVIATFEAALIDGDSIIACRHVVREHRGASACFSHPGAGVMCNPCFARHIRRHTPRCPGCGADPDCIGYLGVFLPRSDVCVRDVGGYHRPAPLIPYPVFLCGDCHRAAA